MQLGWEYLNEKQEWIASTLEARSGSCMLTIPRAQSFLMCTFTQVKMVIDKSPMDGPMEKKRKASTQVDILDISFISCVYIYIMIHAFIHSFISGVIIHVNDVPAFHIGGAGPSTECDPEEGDAKDFKAGEGTLRHTIYNRHSFKVC